MPIQGIPLPFGRVVYVCDICGFSDERPEAMERCQMAPAEDPDAVQISVGCLPFAVGGVVSIYRQECAPRSNRRVRSAERSHWRITGIRYRQPRHRMEEMMEAMILSGLGRKELRQDPEPPVHEMEISLAQTGDGSPMLEEGKSISSFRLTARQCALWHKGYEDQLIAAGLISPPPPPKPAKRWWQFWK